MPLLSLRSCRIPPPILGPTKIASCQPTIRLAGVDFAEVYFCRLRQTVTNDSIALNSGQLTWVAFVRIRFAFLVSVQPEWAVPVQFAPLRVGTVNRELNVREWTSETPRNPARVWCGTSLQITDDDLSLEPGILSEVTGIGLQVCANDFDLGPAGSWSRRSEFLRARRSWSSAE